MMQMERIGAVGYFRPVNLMDAALNSASCFCVSRGASSE
jgi:hypothetical protein